jgi:hypothetical protein
MGGVEEHTIELRNTALVVGLRSHPVSTDFVWLVGPFWSPFVDSI